MQLHDMLHKVMFYSVCIFSIDRLEDLPLILFMEWSKSTRPVPKEETDGIEVVTAPSEESLSIRDELEMLKLRLNNLTSSKEALIRQLNDINDATVIARSRCESLDDVCEAMSERLNHVQEIIKKEIRACEELQCRVNRDYSKAVIGNVASMVDGRSSESAVHEYLYNEVNKASDPDGLLTTLGSYADQVHRMVKENFKQLQQLKTAVHSLKKDVDDAGQRLAHAERARLVRKVVSTSSTAPRPIPVDKKSQSVKPSLESRGILFQDDLARPRKHGGQFSKLFN